jgi:asparagine synthase (glutamine-hydrolysing)
MCGIFALLNASGYDKETIKEQFNKGKSRGPESSTIQFNEQPDFVFGFHRLAINGLNSESDQPIHFNGVSLICNGEIYNYKELYECMKITPNTGSDCEVIIHLYLKYGIEQTLTMLDGVFAFVLYDKNIGELFVARDPLGVRSLYKLQRKKETQMSLFVNSLVAGFASELKCLEHFYNDCIIDYTLEQFEPGTYSKFITLIHNSWKQVIYNKKYFIPAVSTTIADHREFNTLSNPSSHKLFHNISRHLNSAVIKRCNTTERPVACLLSGGLDSSLIAALVADYFRGKEKQIETYSIGLENSEDIKYARIVADYIGSKHTEIIVTEEEMFNAIPEVIKAIESYDTTTVRASIGNYLIGKYIAANSDAKVIFNGDGSDELFGGYLYMNNCPDDIEFDKETRRLLKDIHLFDVLRSDKSISSNGLEPRTPFLDRGFVNHILSIPPYYRNHNNEDLQLDSGFVNHDNKNPQEKFLLRNSFIYAFFIDKKNRQILPEEILYRRKEAFSDGVSSQQRTLFTILQEYIAEDYKKKTNEEHKPSLDLEKRYYKEIFNKEYPNCTHILPYYWMPKYTDATDPSARTLKIYHN